MTAIGDAGIHDRIGYEEAEDMIDARGGHALNPARDDQLAIISDRVEAYELRSREWTWPAS